jgi:hypothetical protein
VQRSNLTTPLPFQLGKLVVDLDLANRAIGIATPLLGGELFGAVDRLG